MQRGATHQAVSETSHDVRFEVLVLKDLLSFLTNLMGEEAHQKQLYRED